MKASIFKRLALYLSALGTAVSLAACSASGGASLSAGALETGSLIQFGHYLGEPVLWQVIGTDDFGNPLLYSDRILTYKAFDNAFWLANTDKNYGNNYWASCDLRTWLNSQAEYVSYDKDGAPTDGTVLDGYNSYEGEPGFLYGFSEAERGAIFPSRNHQLVDEVNQNAEAVEAPTAPLHRYDSAIDSCMTNYESARYLYSTDKVFLLDLQEFHDLVYQAGFSLEKQPTQAAAGQAEHLRRGFDSYWLRTPRCSCAQEDADPKYNGSSAKPDGASVRTVFSDSLVLARDAYDGTVGVVPALYLKHTTLITGGSGTREDPYQTDGSQYGIELFTHDKALLSGQQWSSQVKGLGLEPEVSWSVVSGEDTVTAAADGTFTANSPGTALVRAQSTQDPDAADHIRITVYENLPEHTPAALSQSGAVWDAAQSGSSGPSLTVTAGSHEVITGISLSAGGSVFELQELTISPDGKSASFSLALLAGQTLQDAEPYTISVDVAQSGRFLGARPGRELVDPTDTLSFTLTVENLPEPASAV